MTDDLRAHIATAIRAAAYYCNGDCGKTEAECDAEHPIQVAVWHYDVVTDVAGPVEALANAVMEIVQPIIDELTENEGVIKALRRQRDKAEAERNQLRLELRDAEAQRDPLVVNEMTGSYLIGPKVASAGLYNTVLRRAIKAEAERDGHREVQKTTAEQAVARIRALHQPYRSVYDEGDSQSCAHCNMLAAPGGIVVPWPCDTIRALEGDQ